MKKSHRCTPLFFALFSLALFTACNGQKKPDPPKGNAGQPAPSDLSLIDHDPYFVETTAVTSSRGPASITRNMIQDSKGKIWLAAWEGIIRYDPALGEFTNLTNQQGLRRFHAFAVLEDSKGNLWFGTIGAGVYRYDPSASLRPGGESFTNFTTKDGLANDRVTCVYEDKAGNIWFGTEGGASRYDGKSFRNFTTNEGLPNQDVNVIIEDRNGKYWIGARGEACTYDPSASLSAGGKTFTKLTNEAGAPFVNVRSIIEDRRGNIWLGGNGGLWRYDPSASLKPDGKSFTNFTQNFIGYIYEDREGNIWTSSEDGSNRAWVLSRYDASSLSGDQATPTRIRSEEGMYFGIMEDVQGGIWFGNLNGVCRYDGRLENGAGPGEAFDCFRGE